MPRRRPGPRLLGRERACRPARRSILLLLALVCYHPQRQYVRNITHARAHTYAHARCDAQLTTYSDAALAKLNHYAPTSGGGRVLLLASQVTVDQPTIQVITGHDFPEREDTIRFQVAASESDTSHVDTPAFPWGTVDEAHPWGVEDLKVSGDNLDMDTPLQVYMR